MTRTLPPDHPAMQALIAFVQTLAKRQAQIDAIEAGEATIEDCDPRPPGGVLQPLFYRPKST